MVSETELLIPEDTMTATYTFDVFCTLDGFGSYDEPGDWGGYWGKQGPQLLGHRLELYSAQHRMVLGATTMRVNLEMLGPNTEGAGEPDPWVERMRAMPTTVISSTLDGPLDWPDVTIARGEATEVVARLKAESDVPIRSHGSLTLNRSLMAAGLVDQVQVTIFPVISGATGVDPIFGGAADFDLELIESRTFDGRTQELAYRPTLRR
jgi:dihydrofolate reductase